MSWQRWAPVCWVLVLAGVTGGLSAGGTASSPLDVRAAGARGNAVAKDTAAVQRAIDACAAGGGGTVAFPAGTYLCGSLHLRSHVTLRLEAGAVIMGSPDDRDYDPVETLGFKNDADEETSFFHRALIWGEGLERVAIVGEGTIDCNATKRHGPKAIALKRCKYVDIKRVTLRDCANYNISLLGTDFVNIDGVAILNGYADGIDPDACKNVRISNCHIDSHDDAIVPKASFSLGEHRACENLCVTNCYLASDAYCFKLGTESGGDFKHVTVSNCVLASRAPGKKAGAGIALETVDGSDLEGVTISGIEMHDVHAPIFLRLGNRGRDQAAPAPGKLHEVIIRNVVATNADVPCSITGLPGHNVSGVTLSDINLSYGVVPSVSAQGADVPEIPAKYPLATMFGPLPAYGLYVRHVEGLVLRNVRLTLPAATVGAGSALVCDDVTRLRIDGFGTSPLPPGVPAIDFANVRDALIQGETAPAAPGVALRVRGAESSRISVLAGTLAGVTVECAGDVRRGAVTVEGSKLRKMLVERKVKR